MSLSLGQDLAERIRVDSSTRDYAANLPSASATGYWAASNRLGLVKRQRNGPLPVRVEHEGADDHIVVGESLDFHLDMETTEDGDPIQLTNIVIHPAGPTLNVAIAGGVTNSPFGIDWSGDNLSGFSNPFAWAA